jgi:RNA polymerase sigma-70 factor (ECF subfamily)
MLHSVEDSVLISQYISGDQKSIELLIHRYKGLVFKTILSKVKSTEVSEDIFQDTFIKIIQQLHQGKYNEEGKFLPWALRIANNLVIDYFRRQNARIMISESSSNSDTYTIFTHMDSSDENWLQKTMRSELETQVVQTMEHLPVNQKEVLYMRIFEELSFKEIAELKNISINTALGRMRYAVQNIKKMMMENNVVADIY